MDLKRLASPLVVLLWRVVWQLAASHRKDYLSVAEWQVLSSRARLELALLESVLRRRTDSRPARLPVESLAEPVFRQTGLLPAE
jgi:hypothetical protein